MASPESPDKGEENESAPSAPGKPMERFRSLAQQLLRVRPEELPRDRRKGPIK